MTKLKNKDAARLNPCLKVYRKNNVNLRYNKLYNNCNNNFTGTRTIIRMLT